MEGTVFDIQRFSLHDGPGIRTTVFVKGCPLRCFWCQNPEGLHGNTELQFTQNNCIDCGNCFAACPQGVHALENGKHILHLDRCTACGKCVEVCYSGALALAGSEMTVEEVMQIVRQDREYFSYSHGGMTISGGEPFLQPDFIRELLSACRREGIHTAIESCLSVSWSTIDSVRHVTDLFMCDVKHVDAQAHRKGTRVSNEQILKNLKNLDETAANLLIRIPVIPGFNNDEETIKKIGAFLTSLSNIRLVELLPFHRLGESKYTSLGLSPRTESLPSVSSEEIRQATDILDSLGLPVNRDTTQEKANAV